MLGEKFFYHPRPSSYYLLLVVSFVVMYARIQHEVEDTWQSLVMSNSDSWDRIVYPIHKLMIDSYNKAILEIIILIL